MYNMIVKGYRTLSTGPWSAVRKFADNVNVSKLLKTKRKNAIVADLACNHPIAVT